MSNKEKPKNSLEPDDILQRLAEEAPLGPDALDPIYLRKLEADADLLNQADSSGRKIQDSVLFDAIRQLINREHYSIDAIVQILTKYKFKKTNILKAYKIIKAHDTEEGRREVERLIYKNPLIVPPGLISAVVHFESHFAASGDEPIMISGPTGVGKTLFLYLTKRLYQKQRQNEEKVPPIVEANCGHFAGKTSDLNIVRSELFGHVKGSSSGADENKIGLVEKADGGLLVLEEVGELPFEAQAMLLTFIETGEYRRIGDEETHKAQVQIVAATNRESDLRKDFRYRFFPYNIPPLRERKGDILYYFYGIFPELTKGFTRSEVLLLLSHDWSGGVREIERIGRLLMRNRGIAGGAAENGLRPIKISHLDHRDTSFDPGMLDKLCGEFKKWDIDLALVERLLKKHRISLSEVNNDPAFPELEQADDYSTWLDEFALKFSDEYKPFQEAYEGYQRFCDLFLQDTAKEANVLATLRDCLSPFDVPIRWSYPKSYGGQIEKLGIAIMKYLKKIRKSDKQLPRSPYKAWIALEELEDAVDRGAESSVLSKEALDEISKLKEDKLLKQYYDKLLKTSGGNVRAAAIRTGLEENTFRSRLYKLGIKTKKQS